ncbi:hypothetical protein [Gemmata sp.]|uniref:hypothetical protein n=1 Tax=Gemmata sp. TaxID=1914242 RepID=UPI003F724A73
MRRLVYGLLGLVACGTAAAQQAPPPGLPTARIGTVFPAGAKAGPPQKVTALGVTVAADELTVTGTDLDEPERLYFSHPGITGTFVPPPEQPIDPKKKDPPPAKKANATAHKFKVAVAADVPPGTYDVRFVGKYGVSNPRAFVVGALPELYEREPNNDVGEAQRVALGTTINGVLTANTDVDYSVFTAKKGQRVVIACRASTIDTRATPMIEVYSAAGTKFTSNRNYKDGDAVADLIAPEDGDYLVRLAQFAYQGGGADFVYRLTVGTGPWIDAVFPPVIEPGKPAQVTLYGRNLPGGQPADGFAVDGRPLEKLTVTVTPPTDPAAATRLAVRDRIDPATALQDGFEYVFTGPTGASNPVPIYFAREKVVVKKNAGGSTPSSAEPITAPCEVAGFIARRGDSDWYSFDAKKGEALLIDLAAVRIGVEADFYLSVRDGKDPKRDLSGEQDDDPDSLHPFGFYTRSTDPAPYKFTAPEDGKYLILVGCREAGVLTGPRATYRLRVAPARPDFRAVAMPYSRFFQSGPTAWQGGTQALDVFVHRADGYSGAVTVTAEGLPAGVTAKPVTIGPGARWGVLVLQAAANAAPVVAPITLKATGPGPDGKPVTREVRPATVTWGTVQQNANTPVIARLDQSLVLAVRPEKAQFALAVDAAGATIKLNGKDEKLAAPIIVKQGDKFTVPVKVNWAAPEKQPVTLTAEPLAPNPQNAPLTVQAGAQPTKEKPEGTLNFDVKPNAAPGVYAVTVKGVAQVPFVRDTVAKQKANVPEEEFADPLLVTVIPTSLAKLTVANMPGALKLGATGELVVKVERQFDYAGPYTVKFAAPMGTTGVTADEVTIPAGQSEVKLVVRAAADAKPGSVSNATVTVAALYDNKHPVTHEAKVTFTVAK